jgi:cyclopropane-fatty-acyl-phospholipid synthase
VSVVDVHILPVGQKSPFGEGLPVEIRLQDYRDLCDQFDRIVSIGMFEHVGPKNYKEYMEVAANNLKDDGIMLLHTIGQDRAARFPDRFIGKYIFPNGALPDPVQITTAIKGRLVLRDWHEFGAYYDKTLMAWHANFEKHWNKLKDNYDTRFYRMWRYYLLICAAGFRSGNNRLWQIVFTKDRHYVSVR